MSHTILSDEKIKIISDQIMYEQFRERNSDNSEKRKKMVKFILISINTVLTSKQKYCIEQRYFYQKTQVEIAKELGVDVSGVSRHLSRAYTKIKKNLPYFEITEG